jgi:hypothetical protein
VSAPTGGAGAPITGPAGALLGMGLFELNPAVRAGMFVGNSLATASTGLTVISDIITGETNDIQSLTISNNGLEYNRDLTIGRDTLTSAALTGAGWASPIGITSAPLQGAAVLNDIGLLYIPQVAGVFSLIPKSIKLRDQHFRIELDKE